MISPERNHSPRWLPLLVGAIVLSLASPTAVRADEPKEARASASESPENETDEDDDGGAVRGRGERELGDVEIHAGPSLLVILPYLTAGGTVSLGKYAAVVGRMELFPIDWPLLVGSGHVRFQFPFGSLGNGTIYTNFGLGSRLPQGAGFYPLVPVSKFDLGGQHVYLNGMTIAFEIGGGVAIDRDTDEPLPHAELRFLLGHQF